MIATTYGLGGYDPDHPNGNIVEQVEDNGDGTHTRTVFDEKGNPEKSETYAVDAPEPPPPSEVEKLAALLVEKGVLTKTETESKLDVVLADAVAEVVKR